MTQHFEGDRRFTGFGKSDLPTIAPLYPGEPVDNMLRRLKTALAINQTGLAYRRKLHFTSRGQKRRSKSNYARKRVAL